MNEFKAFAFFSLGLVIAVVCFGYALFLSDKGKSMIPAGALAILLSGSYMWVLGEIQMGTI